MKKVVLGFIEQSLGLVNRQWYRRWRGGHWERCWVDVCWGYVWMQLDHDTAAASAIRRYSTMERLFECEDW